METKNIWISGIIATLLMTGTGTFFLLQGVDISPDNCQMINDSKVLIQVCPATITGSQYVYAVISSKQFTGNVDMGIGVNGSNAIMTSFEVYKNVTDVNGTYETFVPYNLTQYSFDYDGKDTWNVGKNIPVVAGRDYLVRFYLDVVSGTNGKYDFVMKPSAQTFAQAMANNVLYILDPWWNSTSNQDYNQSVYPNYWSTINNGSSTARIQPIFPYQDNILISIGGENTANDELGRYTVTNTGVTYSTSCKIGSCLSHDTTDNLALGFTPPVNQTISMWINFTFVTSMNYYLFDEGSNKYQFQIYDNDANGKPSIYFNGVLLVNENNLSNNTWTHLVLNASTTAAQLYINGNFAGNNTYASTTLGNMIIGKYGGGASNYYIGQIDEFKMYNKNFNTTEVQAEYNNNNNGRKYQQVNVQQNYPFSESLIGYYRFENNTLDENYIRSGIIGGTLNYPSGKIGNGSNFTGAFTPHVNISNLGALNNFSISFWYKFNANSAGVFLGSQNGVTAIRLDYGISVPAGQFGFITNIDGPNYRTGRTTTYSYNANWHHIVLTRNTTILHIYIDGVDYPLTYTNGGSTAGAINTNSIYQFGHVTATGAYYINAVMDEVMFFNKTLNSSEVTALYNLQNAGNITDSSANMFYSKSSLDDFNNNNHFFYDDMENPSVLTTNYPVGSGGGTRTYNNSVFYNGSNSLRITDGTANTGLFFINQTLFNESIYPFCLDFQYRYNTSPIVNREAGLIFNAWPVAFSDIRSDSVNGNYSIVDGTNWLSTPIANQGVNTWKRFTLCFEDGYNATGTTKLLLMNEGVNVFNTSTFPRNKLDKIFFMNGRVNNIIYFDNIKIWNYTKYGINSPVYNQSNYTAFIMNLTANDNNTLVRVSANNGINWTQWYNVSSNNLSLPFTVQSNIFLFQLNITQPTSYVTAFGITSSSGITPIPGPVITFISQVPPDINSTNVLNTRLNITYNVTNGSSNQVNSSSVMMYHKITGNRTYFVFTNGTGETTEFDNVGQIISNVGITWQILLSELHIYPATYNYNETAMRLIPHTAFVLNGNNDMAKIQLFNMSNVTRYNWLEVMVNGTSTTADVFYCNSSYTTGSVVSSTNCIGFGSILPNTAYDHNHSNYSSHKNFPLSIVNGSVGTIKVTSVSQFVIHVQNPSPNWNVYYIPNKTRVNASMTSINNGASWTDLTGTFDAHLHQFDGSEYFNYYMTACDNNATCTNSSIRQDLLDLGGQPPTVPFIIIPTDGSFNNGSINITYLASVSPNGYNISYYNISLLNSSLGFIKTIRGNNGLNLSYLWNMSNESNGYYAIKVEVKDVNNLTSNDVSDVFVIRNFVITANTCPGVSSNLTFNFSIRSYNITTGKLNELNVKPKNQTVCTFIINNTIALPVSVSVNVTSSQHMMRCNGVNLTTMPVQIYPSVTVAYVNCTMDYINATGNYKGKVMFDAI